VISSRLVRLPRCRDNHLVAALPLKVYQQISASRQMLGDQNFAFRANSWPKIDHAAIDERRNRLF
jgi:hypothetical protein